MGYMRFEDNLGFKDCEMWISQFNGRVFHFHNCTSEAYFSYAGGNPIDQKRGDSLALYINVTSSEEELEIELRSFHKAFIRSERVVSHVEFSKGFPKGLGRLPNQKESDWLDWYHDEIVVKRKNSHSATIPIKIGSADRMIAKIALGVGWNLFGLKFLKSPYCAILRNYMWEQDFEKRSALRVLRSDGDFSDRLVFPDRPYFDKNITILILSIGHAIIFIINVYGDEQSIQLTDDLEMSSSFAATNPDGIAYAVNPIYETVQGPMGMMELFSLGGAG